MNTQDVSTVAVTAVSVSWPEIKFPSLHVKDLRGQKKHMLTIMDFIAVEKGFAIWSARCDCGGTTKIKSRCFGYTKSCGCLAKHRTGKQPWNFKDLTGQKMGRLTIVKYVRRDRTKYGILAIWLTKCDCGTEMELSSRRLLKKRSCGCLYRESRRWQRGVVRCKLPPGVVERKRILERYKATARERSLTWALSDDQFFTLTSSQCHYCGCEPQSVKRMYRNGGCLLWNGVDRVDNNVGYTPCNSVPCCKHCNHAKRDMTHQEFMNWVGKVYRHCLRKPTSRQWQMTPFLFPAGPEPIPLK